MTHEIYDTRHGNVVWRGKATPDMLANGAARTDAVYGPGRMVLRPIKSASIFVLAVAA